MRDMVVTWMHLEVQGATCERCSVTGAALRALVDAESPSFAARGIRLVLQELRLGPFELHDSNTVLIAGRPVEYWLQAEVVHTCCPSCGCLTGNPAECRALVVEGETHEILDDVLLRKAMHAAANSLEAIVQD